MGSKEKSGFAEEQVGGRNGDENSDMDEKKSRKVEVEEEGIEGKEKMSGDSEEAALKMPKKRGRKRKGEEGKSSDFVAVKEEESGEKLDENGEDIGSIKEEVNLGAAGNGQGDVSKRRLRSVAKKSYAEVQEIEDDESVPKKRGRRGGPKKEAVKPEDQEDGLNENGDNIMHAKKSGRGRPRKQATESESNEVKDVDNGNKRIRRRGKNDGNKMDEEVSGNGSLGMNESEDLVRPLKVPAEEKEPVPDSKRKRDVKV